MFSTFKGWYMLSFDAYMYLVWSYSVRVEMNECTIAALKNRHNSASGQRGLRTSRGREKALFLLSWRAETMRVWQSRLVTEANQTCLVNLHLVDLRFEQERVDNRQPLFAGKKRSFPGDKSFSCLLTSLRASCPTRILTCQKWFASSVKSGTRGSKKLVWQTRQSKN